MLLRERRKLQLDDEIGRHVAGLNKKIARATVSQLLSHSAGVVRDGGSLGQWFGRRPFWSEAELRRDLAENPILDANTRFKYSNHGFALLGLAIEAISGEPWRDFIAREVIKAAGLKETLPDGPPPRGTPLAMGHSTKALLRRRYLRPRSRPTPSRQLAALYPRRAISRCSSISSRLNRNEAFSRSPAGARCSGVNGASLTRASSATTASES